MTHALTFAAPRQAWSRRWLIGVLVLLAVLASAALAGGWMATRAKADLLASATAEARFRAAILGRHLQQFRDVPKVLAEDRDVQGALTVAPEAPQAQALSRKFERLITLTEVEAIYLIGPDGVSRAASNWRIPNNFVGRDYAFRPYFTNALERGAYDLFALGTVSAEAGFYIAQRVVSDTARGVIVAKIHLNDVEEEWRNSLGRVAVTDPRGVVVLTSVPEWRFGATRALSPADVEEIARSRQFGASADLPSVTLPPPGDAGGKELAISLPVEGSEWTFSYLASTEPMRTARDLGVVLGAFAALLLSGAVLALRSLRQRANMKRRNQEAARLELETRVTERTRELNDANAQLLKEASDRRKAELNARLLQDELIQANRLAILGQISAGVAHEINQPLAAIRAFADNAVALLDRASPDDVRANLADIAELSDRIAAITDELRGMARKNNATLEPVDVGHALDGALLLIGARARASGVTITREFPQHPLIVRAHRMRLEQVLLNVLQNALDACEVRPDPQILIAARGDGSEVHIEISDNGPGIAPQIAQTLFTPFNTTKPTGLGLGLVISLEICREYGGRLEPMASPLGGAGFRIGLPARP